MKYVFDGSFNGFLSCVFTAFERKEFDCTIENENVHQPDFFQQSVEVITEEEKAQRIVVGLKKLVGAKTFHTFFQAFLSEDPQALQVTFNIMVRLFQGEKNLLNNFGDADVLYFHQTLKKVSRERHRMKAFIRFSKDSNGLYLAVMEPDFNVLPLIIPFFKNRYADQQWIIYDTKRNYGALFNGSYMEEVVMDKGEASSLSNPATTIELDERDELFQQLWKRYFNSTNIVERKNMKLHLQHVPRRYWKFLAEKG